jgi:hypothetical protein
VEGGPKGIPNLTVWFNERSFFFHGRDAEAGGDIFDIFPLALPNELR